MPNLQNVSITFHTHNDDRRPDTVVHVFVKNRRSSSSMPEGNTTFIANELAYEAYFNPPTGDFNPYLARAVNLALGLQFDDPSSHTFTIPLRGGPPIPREEIILPVVNIHMVANGSDRWIFDYEITFTFDDQSAFSSASNVNGVTGIILNQDNRDYSGICIENPLNPQPSLPQPQTTALLTKVLLEFGTHNDDKDNDTKLNVHIVNRLSNMPAKDIAIGVDLLTGQRFADDSPDGTPNSPSDKRIVFGAGGLPLASNAIRLHDIVLPVVNINIGPNGNDRWIFDYRVTYFFSNGQAFSSSTYGVILDQDNHKHAGVYQGHPFPTVTPAGKPDLTGPPINQHILPPKVIPLTFLQKKLDELINHRQGVDFHSSPITKLRLHNTGFFKDPLPPPFGSALPISYYDVQSLKAAPPLPGTVLPPNFQEGIDYKSSPTEIGQLINSFLGVDIGDLYLNDINSQTITANIDPSNHVLPITVVVTFETGGGNETIGGVGGMDFTQFSIRLSLTLTPDLGKGLIDVMSWVDEIKGLKVRTLPPNQSSVRVTGQFLGKPVDVKVPSFAEFKSELISQVIDVHVVTTKKLDPGGIFQKTMRGKIFDTLSNPHLITETTTRDQINAFANSWFLGGEVQFGSSSPVPYAEPCKVLAAEFVGDTFVISYSGPQQTFAPTVPANWPPASEFDPGTLANIDHIVVLTMENRSFDHMLGYLSLPPEKGGLGRTDVDGLKGTEVNFLPNGAACPSFAFKTGETVFSLDPPHGYEPVARAINGGKMDGFATVYAEERGTPEGFRIMGYHTAANVPIYDALVRDFALCQRWFAPHPGPTFCNRFYETTGRLNIDPYGFWENDNSSPLRPAFTPTIFDHLTDAGISWKYFESHYCFLRFFEGHTFDSTNIATFDDPEFGFVNLARTGNLPSVTFIDPHFIELPPDANCDGPPADIAQGQKLVEQVVNAVVAGPAWEKTLLIVTYDEHGGFYDHVPPPPATPNSPTSLSTYGVRVPAFVISPWVQAGEIFGQDSIIGGGGSGGVGTTGDTHAVTEAVVSEPVVTAPGTLEPAGGIITQFQSFHFDHTSILKTIAKRFLSKNPPYMSARFAAARDLSLVVGNQLRPDQFRPFIPYNLVYGASQKRLDVHGGSSTPGTILWQFDPNTTPAQQFSFEDAGNGFFYLRTHTGRLYVTADAPAGTTGPIGIKEDVKYLASGTGANSPDLQRWQFSSSSITILDRNHFTVSNAAFPGLVLRPSGDSTQSGVVVVLDVPTGHQIGVLHTRNPWLVTSPLLPDAGQVLHP